ncbi:hypothetical protein PAHAL_4G275800 [Panicum hallii]|uniref:Uncharacterized protein n=1 Tax=Panicum hallii TaxID=206008 RepID=A0A2T8JE62_9POAL|nr:hypothetical protein PAHAL_4G275800 [Panicum hallii]
MVERVHPLRRRISPSPSCTRFPVSPPSAPAPSPVCGAAGLRPTCARCLRTRPRLSDSGEAKPERGRGEQLRSGEARARRPARVSSSSTARSDAAWPSVRARASCGEGLEAARPATGRAQLDCCGEAREDAWPSGGARAAGLLRRGSPGCGPGGGTATEMLVRLAAEMLVQRGRVAALALLALQGCGIMADLPPTSQKGMDGLRNRKRKKTKLV